jgi:hypothetical protein
LSEYLGDTPVSRFPYGLLTIFSLAYALAGMGVMLISILLTLIGNEWSLDLVTRGLLASAGYLKGKLS